MSLLEQDVSALNLHNLVDNKVQITTSQLCSNNMRAAGWVLSTRTPDDESGVSSSELNRLLRGTSMGRNYYTHLADLREWFDIPGLPIKVSAATRSTNISVPVINQDQGGTDLSNKIFKIALAHVVKAWSLTKDHRFEKTTPIDWVENVPFDFSTPYPEPNFVFPPDVAAGPVGERQYRKQAAIASLVALSPEKIKSDAGIERAIRSAILNILTSDTESISLQSGDIEFPSALNLTDSTPSADFFIRMVGGLGGIQPVLVLGESQTHLRGAKRSYNSRDPTANGDPMANTLDYRARMAAAAHGTMILLILHHLSQYRLPHDAATRKDENGDFVEIPDLPHHCLLYGVYYDHQTFDVLAHFPVLQDDSKHGTRYWRFCQVPLAHINLLRKHPTESRPMFVRWRVAVATETIQKQVETLHKWFMEAHDGLVRRYYDRNGAFRQVSQTREYNDVTDVGAHYYTH